MGVSLERGHERHRTAGRDKAIEDGHEAHDDGENLERQCVEGEGEAISRTLAQLHPALGRCPSTSCWVPRRATRSGAAGRVGTTRETECASRKSPPRSPLFPPSSPFAAAHSSRVP